MNGRLDLVPSSRQHRLLLPKRKPPAYPQFLTHTYTKGVQRQSLCFSPVFQLLGQELSLSYSWTCRLLFQNSMHMIALCMSPYATMIRRGFRMLICLTLTWIEILSGCNKASSVYRHCILMVCTLGDRGIRRHPLRVVLQLVISHLFSLGDNKTHSSVMELLVKL